MSTHPEEAEGRDEGSGPIGGLRLHLIDPWKPGVMYEFFFQGAPRSIRGYVVQVVPYVVLKELVSERRIIVKDFLYAEELE